MKKTKRVFCFGIAIILIMATFIAGCTIASVTSAGITGTYVNSKNTDESIELSSDGTFYYMTDTSKGYHGKWDSSGDTVRLNTEVIGITIQLKHKDNTLIMSNRYGPDTVFVKQ